MDSNSGSLSELPENNLRNNVVSALRQKGYRHHRMLEINIDHGTVIVEGILPTYFLRQIAVECIKRVTGVVRVVDRIQVVRESQYDHSPYFDLAYFPRATENDRLRMEACSTTSIPDSDMIAVPLSPRQIPRNDCVEDEHKSLYSWMQPQIEIRNTDQPLFLAQ